MKPPVSSGQPNATSGTPHQDDRPMAGAAWLKVNGKALADDAPVIVGASTYLAGERINAARETSIPDIPPVDDNIFTGSATIRISVENMPPVLASRILNLMDAVVSILRAGNPPEILVEGWRHIDTTAR